MRSVVLGVCLLLSCRPAAAEEIGDAPHLRAEARDVAALIAETERRSATFRALVDVIDRANVIVYVRMRVLPSQLIDGRTGLLGSSAGRRFLAIELGCPRRLDVQMATLAHELQHAVEIAGADWVVGAATLRRYYQNIGRQVGGDGAVVTFETEAARLVGERVRQELLAR